MKQNLLIVISALVCTLATFCPAEVKIPSNLGRMGMEMQISPGGEYIFNVTMDEDMELDEEGQLWGPPKMIPTLFNTKTQKKLDLIKILALEDGWAIPKLYFSPDGPC